MIIRRLFVSFIAFAYVGFAQGQVLNAPLLPNTINCTPAETVCANSTPCRDLGNGMIVCLAGVAPPSGGINNNESCWEYKTTYTCLQKTDDCLNLRSTPGCVEQPGSPTCANDANGSPMVDSRFGCTAKTHTFKCSNTKGGGGSGTANPNCTTTASVAGLTWSTSSPSAQGDFVLAVVARETQNQVGSEIRRGMSLFKGEVDKCVIKIGGLKNCCDGGGGNQSSGSNFDVASNVGFTVGFAALTYGAKYASYNGSMFVYDTLVNNGGEAMANSWAATAGLWDKAGEGSLTGFGGGIGAMGFGTTAGAAEGLAGSLGGSAVSSTTIGFSASGEVLSVGAANAAAAEATAAAAEATAAAADLVAAGADAAAIAEATTAAAEATAAAAEATTAAASMSEAAVLFFNPVALVAAVAIMVVMQLVMEYLSCDQDSQKTVNLKSKGICHYIGSYCSSKLSLGFTTVCLETSQSYCCYNGLLAKDIEEGAHAQLGGTWGSPESPVCGVFDPATPDAGNNGLSVNLLTQLDFNAIDLSEFAGQVANTARTLGGGDMQIMQGNAATKLK